LQQVSKRNGKGNIAIYGNTIILAVKHPFAPIARESIFIKEHGRTSPGLRLRVTRRALH
jgi:hypothetical protein